MDEGNPIKNVERILKEFQDIDETNEEIDKLSSLSSKASELQNDENQVPDSRDLEFAKLIGEARKLDVAEQSDILHLDEFTQNHRLQRPILLAKVQKLAQHKFASDLQQQSLFVDRFMQQYDQALTDHINSKF